jgi:hypothetical protein
MKHAAARRELYTVDLHFELKLFAFELAGQDTAEPISRFK